MKVFDLFKLFVLITVLGFVMVVLGDYEFGTTHAVFEPKSLAATGFIILAAFAMGEFFKLLRAPALLGYLAAGIVFGPNFFAALHAWGVLETVPDALFSSDVIADLTLINVLTVGVIGTMGGGEIVIADLKRHLKTIVLVAIFWWLLTVCAVGVLVLWLAREVPQFVPFLDGLSLDHHYAAALLFGVLAAGMSPAATLAILQETRSKGSFTSLVLGVVIVADLVLVGTFLLALSFGKILLAPEGFSVDALVAALPAIVAEFGYALVIGVVTGLVFIAYLRFVRREELFFTVAVIFATSYVSFALHAETLLAFLTAGFIVQNFSRHGHDMIHALEKISLPVFLVYFMTQAAQLDLRTVAGFAVLTVVMTVARAVSLYVSTTLAADLAGADVTARRYMWLGLFSLGGVDLVLAQKVADSGFPWGTEFQAVVMALVIVNILVGPPLLKRALDRAGETEGSRRETAAEKEAFDQLPALADAAAVEFPSGRFEDAELVERVCTLRDLLISLHRDFIAEPLQAKAEAMTASLAEASDELHRALDELERVLTSDEFESAQARAEAVARAHVQYLHDIADNVATWEEINPEIVHPDRVHELTAAVRNRVDFGAVHSVPAEAYLFDPQDGDSASVRVLKALRRMRRGLLGTPMRQVPIGRLWRYYVELTLTRYLARAADATSILNERFWADLGNHMRRIDDLFDDVYDAVLASHTVAAAADRSAERGAEDAEADEALGPPDSPLSKARDLLAEGRQAAVSREATIDEDLATLANAAIDRYTVSLRETFARFVSALELAGTVQLPQWQYRPSVLFDSARRAATRIIERARREHTIVTGHRGWIVAEWQLILFLYWLNEYEQSMRGTMSERVMEPLQRELALLAEACARLPEEYDGTPWADVAALRAAIERGGAEDIPAADWERWLSGELRPAIEQARRSLKRLVGLYDKGTLARRLVEPLERRVAEFSEEVVLLSEHPDQLDATRAVPTLTIRLREWFESEVVREMALRLVEFEERGEAILRTCLASLDEVQHVLEFNLVTAQADATLGRHTADIASVAIENAARMVDEMRAAQERRVEQLATWIVEESQQIAERAADPFLQHRHAELERLMNRRGQMSLAARSENALANAVDTVTAALRGTYQRWSPLVREVVEDVQGLFVEEVEPIRHADIRERLHPDERITREIPAIYRRLFTPVPLDIPDFYVPRVAVETAAAAAVQDWVDHRRCSMLVYGERGSGKRSTIQHLLHHASALSGVRGKYPIHAIAFDDDLQTEEELVQRLASVLQAEAPSSIGGLVRLLELLESRHIIVVENGEKLFSRTDAGLELARNFLRAMNDSSGSVLWIVLMASPTVTYLDTAIGLLDYFTHSFEVGPLGEPELRQMIERRHRVSGFRANFVRDQPRIRDWLSRPLGTSEALRDPKGEFFRDVARLSGGNPMGALLYWLEATEVDAEDDHLIWLSTLPDREPDFVAALSLPKQLLLAALVQHRSLTGLQLQSILRLSHEDVHTELEHLERLGFVRQVVGHRATAWGLTDLADLLVTTRLRERNMI